jgi:hypothetical protein
VNSYNILGLTDSLIKDNYNDIKRLYPSLGLPEKLSNSYNLTLSKMIIIKELILSKAYLLEILKDILCIWRQPYCTNPSICPGTDLYRGMGLTKVGSELVSKLFDLYKNDNNIQDLLLQKFIKPDILKLNLYFEKAPTNTYEIWNIKQKLYPSNVQKDLITNDIVSSYINNKPPKKTFFKYSWILKITTKFFNIALKIHPRYWLRDTGISEVFIESTDEKLETDTLNNDCIDFEDLVAGKTYTTVANNNKFISEGVEFEVVDRNPFDSNNGNIKIMPSPGNMNNLTGHFGQYLYVNNKILKLDLTQPNVLMNNNTITSCCFNYYHGGNYVFMAINGQNIIANPQENTFMNYHNKVVDNVLVKVTQNVIELVGRNIDTIEIGGQELFVDHFCIPCRTDNKYDDCIDFEDLIAGSSYGNGDILVSEDVTFNIKHVPGFNTGKVIVKPVMVPTPTFKPPHNGQFLHVNNIILRLDMIQIIRER